MRLYNARGCNAGLLKEPRFNYTVIEMIDDIYAVVLILVVFIDFYY